MENRDFQFAKPETKDVSTMGRNEFDNGYQKNATFEINLTEVEKLLHKTALVGVGEYRCPVDHPQFKGGGPEKCPFIVFSRSSVQLIPSRGVSQVCTPNLVNLLDVGDSYQRLPVCDEGAVCDWIALSPSLLRDIAADIDPAIGHESEHIFARPMAPVSSDVFMAQRAFFLTVARDPASTALEVEESAIHLAARVIRETADLRKAANPYVMKNSHSARRIRERIEESKAILALDFSEKMSVADIARKVHWSPGYLARQFLLATGCTLHRYQLRLRLRVALAYLAESRFDGAAIALQLGFATHSHFSAAFAKEFGITPTAFTKELSRPNLSKPFGNFVADVRRAVPINRTVAR